MQGADPHSETVARDLNELTQGRFGEADGCGHAGDAFASDHANFDGFTIFSGDEEGNQATIWEIGKLEFLRGLVEDGALTEPDWFQMGKNEAVFCIRDCQKDLVSKQNRLRIRGVSRMRTSASYIGRQCHSVLSEIARM